MITQVQRTGRKHLSSQRSFQGIPGIARTKGGRLWAVWYSGGNTECKENFSLLCYSDDNGDHWTDAVFAADPEADITRSFDPAIWIDPEGKLHFFWAESSSNRKLVCDGLPALMESVLENPDEKNLKRMKWGKTRRIATGIMLNKPTVLKDDTWVYPVSVWAPGIGGSMVPKNMLGLVGAGLYASTDNGKTILFRGRARCVKDSIFDEHIFTEQKDGSLRVWIRTNYGFAESVSTDGGYNWSTPAPSQIRGPNSRMFIRRLLSGNLLCIVNKVGEGEKAKDGEWLPRKEMIARISDDDGKTWKGELMLDERMNVSYPDADQAPDGTVYAVYDRDRVPNGEIYLARFTEEDILAGKVVSKGSKLKILISKSTGQYKK